MRDAQYLAILRLRIREARQQAKRSQEDVAEEAGLPLRSYQVLEARQLKRPFNPTIKTLRTVARALALKIEALTCEGTLEEFTRLAVEEPAKRVPQKKRTKRSS